MEFDRQITFPTRQYLTAGQKQFLFFWLRVNGQGRKTGAGIDATVLIDPLLKEGPTQAASLVQG